VISGYVVVLVYFRVDSYDVSLGELVMLVFEDLKSSQSVNVSPLIHESVLNGVFLPHCLDIQIAN